MEKSFDKDIVDVDSQSDAPRYDASEDLGIGWQRLPIYPQVEEQLRNKHCRLSLAMQRLRQNGALESCKPADEEEAVSPCTTIR